MPCFLSQSSSPYILKDSWALESQWELIIHRYHHLFHFQLRKKHSAGHFIHFLIKIVKQLPAAHTKLWSQPLSLTKSSCDSSLSAMAHTSLLPLLHLSQHMGTARLSSPRSTLPSVNSVMWHQFGTYLMKTGTWKPPKGRVDLRVRIKQKVTAAAAAYLYPTNTFQDPLKKHCGGSSKL